MAELTPLQLRKVAAIVGACVADAAAQPLHWVYDDAAMQAAIKDREDIEFMEPAANPYYRIKLGRNTCYGDQAYVMLKSLVDLGGLNIEHLTQATYDFFGPSSEYERPVTSEDQANTKESYPVNRPWRHGCIRDFIKNVDGKITPTGSSEDDQIDCAIRIIPLVALYAGQPNMLEMVEKGLRVLQESDMSVAAGLAAARVLEQFILLDDDQGDVLQKVAEILIDPPSPEPSRPGQSCSWTDSSDLPESFQSTMHGVITATDFVNGIRSTIKVGGCNASRSGFIGACWAAKDGLNTIPESWKSKTDRYSEVFDLANRLVQIQI
ncbi:hypothetical protein Btru_056716 [Bulinus truncatus]|nr:hypothetical protein Btru_056716 [Bulinus truncatus]